MHRPSQRHRPATIDGTVVSGALDVVRAARSEVCRRLAVLRARRARAGDDAGGMANNVRVVVMTNSLAATDEPLVHFGYSRYRRAMLKMGVMLYELSPTLDGASRERSATARSSLGRLHAKLAIVDSRWLMVGSMNMDGRSARSNTEIGIVIDSPAAGRRPDEPVSP